ncbi:MAG: histidine kinase [Ferruginibacter sp.]
MALNISADRKVKYVFATVFFLWWFTWGIFHFMILLSFGLTISRARADAIISNILLACACLVVINNMRYYLPKREKYWYLFVTGIALSSLWLLVTRLSLWGLYKEDPAYLQTLSQTTYIRYAIAFLMISCGSTISLLWYTQRDQQAGNKRRLDIERFARDAELNTLRQQLQPHFLFNSLNSISALTGSQPEKARHMIQQLADFLRGTLKNEEQQWTILEEELQHLQLYLEIEKVRFGYRLQTRVTHEPAALQMKIPSMLLQPLVENAIKFGLYDTIGEVTILISARSVNGMLEVTVQNPFDEATSGHVKGTGFGLTSVKRRLFLLFERYDLLEIKKEAQQFITIITIPQLHESNNN